MKWLTYDEIGPASKDDKEALHCSVKHWFQLSTASKAELLSGYSRGVVGTGGQWCALCYRFQIMVPPERSCLDCPIYKETGHVCNDENSHWKVAHFAFVSLRRTRNSDKDVMRDRWEKWRACSTAMYLLLKSIEDKS